MSSIEYFMWGFQRHILSDLQVSAEQFFNQIDPELKPQVFFIGVLMQALPERHPICIEPEDCGYSVRAFSDLKTLAAELEKVDEERNLHNTHPIAQKNQDKKISNKAFMDAISKILIRENIYSDTEKYISYPTYVDGFQVFTVLELQKNAINKHYSLTRTKDLKFDRYKVQRSFIESAVQIYLEDCSLTLKDPQRGYASFNRSADELLREAGKLFMYTISQAGDNFDGLHGLYEACSMIASLKYEVKTEISGLRVDIANLKIDIANLKTDIQSTINKNMQWSIGLIAFIVTALKVVDTIWHR